MNLLRPRLAAFGAVAFAALAVTLGSSVRAEDAPTSRRTPTTWVYDVRVVRVDAAESAIVESAPAWQPAGAGGAVTTAPWADLLAGLKARGRTTTLLDQRLTALGGATTEFRQTRRRPFLQLASRANEMEAWSTTYIETGASGDLLATADGLTYRVDVTWEERPAADESVSLGSASWKGSHATFKAGETLVLSHRQQQPSGEGSAQAIEIYAFVTASSVAAR
jgi:hypothetical protein